MLLEPRTKVEALPARPLTLTTYEKATVTFVGSLQFDAPPTSTTDEKGQRIK